MKQVTVLGVGVHVIDRDSLLRQVIAWAEARSPRRVFYVNAHCLNVAHHDSDYSHLLRQADLVYSDGVGVVWAARVLHRARLYKVTGRHWIDSFCEQAAAKSLGIYLLAGQPGIASQAASVLQARWPGLRVVGVCDGFFIEKSEAQVLDEITQARPSVVFVGMGTPAQEQWCERLVRGAEMASSKPATTGPVCWAVGALFDYIAGLEPPVPYWLDGLSLEWFWRLLVDPRGKWRRYVLGNPIFICRVLWQKISNISKSLTG